MSDIQLSAVQTLRVVSSTPESLHLESTWLPGGAAPPRHWHPRQDEEFEVTSGVLRVELGSDPPRDLGPGERVAIPRRTQHRMWNAGTEETRATWVITPAGRTEEMFRSMAQGMSPLRALPVLWRHRHEMRLGPVRP
jgi:quercetin dioxygenase-like cupin family protein